MLVAAAANGRSGLLTLTMVGTVFYAHLRLFNILPVSVIIFLVPISAFNQNLEEAEDINRLVR